ncbi:hypothetical protein HK101_004237 [Irineochytrium annulatum]|nr:hypothetical protein HK101_004237 [Irineochytrium annulatum]
MIDGVAQRQLAGAAYAAIWAIKSSNVATHAMWNGPLDGFHATMWCLMDIVFLVALKLLRVPRLLENITTIAPSNSAEVSGRRVATYHANINEPGLYRLKRISESNGADGRVIDSWAQVVVCPTAQWSLPSETRLIHKCVYSDFDLAIDATGALPLTVVYEYYRLDGKESQIFELTSAAVDHPLSDDKDVKASGTKEVLVKGRSVHKSLLSTVRFEAEGPYRLRIVEVKDGINNTISYGGHTKRPLFEENTEPLEFVVEAHKRPTARFVNCGSVKMRSGDGYESRSELHVAFDGTGPWDLYFSRSESREDFLQGKVADELLVQKVSKSFSSFPIDTPGYYVLNAVTDEFCEGSVELPSTCLVQVTLPPSVTVSAQPIEQSCVGAIGALVNVSLTGEPPFWLEYDEVYGGERRRERKTIDKLRDTLAFKPSLPGTYLYEFKRVGDATYIDGVAIDNVTVTQIIHPQSDARFDGPNRYVACSGDLVELFVALSGSGPWTLRYELMFESSKQQFVRKRITEDQVRIATPHLENPGTYILDLIGQAIFQRDTMMKIEEKVSSKVAKLNLDTTRDGHRVYTFQSISDGNYKDVDLSKHGDALVIEQTVLRRPNAVFASGQDQLFQCLGMDGDGDVEFNLQGVPPFELILEMKHESQPRDVVRLSNLTDHVVKYRPPSLVTTGKYQIKLVLVHDATGCETVFDPDSSESSKVVQVSDVAKIASSSPTHMCIGDILTYTMQGTAPFRIHYTFDGVEQEEILISDPLLTLYASDPGVVSVTQICNKMQCCTRTNLTHVIHTLPSAIVDGGYDLVEDIREGDEAAIAIDFKGEPPFSFTYLRSELSPQPSAKNLRSDETFTVTGIEAPQYVISTSQEANTLTIGDAAIREDSLESGREGLYPDLESAFQDRINSLDSRALERNNLLGPPPAITSVPPPDVREDICSWQRGVKGTDDKLKIKEFFSVDGPLPPIRFSAEHAVCAPSAEKQAAIIQDAAANKPLVVLKTVKSSVPRDYKTWDKFSVEEELNKLDAESTLNEAIGRTRISPFTPENSRIPVNMPDVGTLPLEERCYLAEAEKVKGNECYKAGDYQDAVDFYTRSLLLRQAANLYANRSLAYLKLNQFEKAEVDAGEALLINDPSYNLKAYLRRAAARIKRGRYIEAISDAKAAVDLDPSDKEATALLSQATEMVESLHITELSSTRTQGTKLKIVEADADEGSDVKAATDLDPSDAESKALLSRATEKADGSHLTEPPSTRKQGTKVKILEVDGDSESEADDSAELRIPFHLKGKMPAYASGAHFSSAPVDRRLPDYQVLIPRGSGGNPGGFAGDRAHEGIIEIRERLSPKSIRADPPAPVGLALNPSVPADEADAPHVQSTEVKADGGEEGAGGKQVKRQALKLKPIVDCGMVSEVLYSPH